MISKIFVYLTYRRRKRQVEISHLLVHYSDAEQPGLGQCRARTSVWVSFMGHRVPVTEEMTCCLPGCLLAGRWSGEWGWDSNAGTTACSGMWVFQVVSSPPLQTSGPLDAFIHLHVFFYIYVCFIYLCIFYIFLLENNATENHFCRLIICNVRSDGFQRSIRSLH